jgi:predicted aconitase with swiveling domain
MLGAPGNRGPQQRPAGDRLAMMLRVSRTDEQVPPVVDQRHHAGGQSAAGQVLRRKAAPSPLVLQLIEPVLAVAAVAVRLLRRNLSRLPVIA